MNRTKFLTRFRYAVMAAGIYSSVIFAQQKYEPLWESLQKHPVPQWFADAKFGIYAHWGIYSVPAYDNEWYPHNMYIEDSHVYQHHIAAYGDPSRYGYKDFIPLFQAEKFNADEWADLYVRAGAKFAGPVAEHHDGFSMWDSRINRWNAADMGPKRDVVGELTAALRKRNLKVITSFHHAHNIQGYYKEKEGWDTADPQYGDLYGKFKDPRLALERWLAKIAEVIDKYQPDQIWFDFGLGKIPDEYKRKMAAYYYNQEAAWGKQVIITRKHDDLPEGVGVFDIERAKMEKPAPFLWQTDDSIAVNTWSYTNQIQLKTAEELIHELIDIVSKNGILLLNICPKADGTIPPDQEQLLLEIGEWLTINGEGIYGTRPWVIHGEGPNLYDPGRSFGEKERERIRFTGQDIRFTTKDDGFYVMCLGWPEQELILESLQIIDQKPGAKITLLGFSEPLSYRIDQGRELRIQIPEMEPEKRPCEHAYTLKLKGFTAEVNPFMLVGSITLEPRQAVFEGDRIRVDNKLGRDIISFWDSPKDQVHWLIRIPSPGRYAVRGEFSAGMGTSEVALESGSEILRATIPRTTDWESTCFVGLGQLRFERSGVYHLILRAADFQNWRPLNVYRLQFAQQ